MTDFILGDVIYKNPLKDKKDIEGWVMEGDGVISFPKAKMRLESKRPVEDGQKSNIVFWCPETFPDNICISWDFLPIREPGLAILFFSAMGRDGCDIFDDSLKKRLGPYNHYFDGDINAYHISYFRRNPIEREFQVCNLRKSFGHHLVKQGPDPIPSTMDIKKSYKIIVVKNGPIIEFGISYNGLFLNCFKWMDDGKSYGPILTGGKIGFRQMAPLIGEYNNLEVRSIKNETPYM